MVQQCTEINNEEAKPLPLARKLFKPKTSGEQKNRNLADPPF
jgi:hypothetical protein